jgi:hypothetical protein
MAIQKFSKVLNASDKELRIMARVGLAKIYFKQNNKPKADAILKEVLSK